jgi:hypothetical protein
LRRHCEEELINKTGRHKLSEQRAALCGIREVGGITIAQKLDTDWAARYAWKRNSERVYRFCTFT